MLKDNDFFKCKEDEERGSEAERSRAVEEQRRRSFLVNRRPIENPVYTVRQKFLNQNSDEFSFSSNFIFKVMNQGANGNGQAEGRRRAFQTPPIHQRTFSDDVRAAVPKQGYSIHVNRK